MNKILKVHIPLNEQGKGVVTVRTPLDLSKQDMNGMELVEDITIWMQKTDGYIVSKEADEAFTTFLGKLVR